MWLLYQDADAWKTTPAALIGVDDEYVAYCLNQSVGYLGRFIEAQMDKAEESAKSSKAKAAARQRVLKKYTAPKRKSGQQQFLDPAMFFQKE